MSTWLEWIYIFLIFFFSWSTWSCWALSPSGWRVLRFKNEWKKWCRQKLAFLVWDSILAANVPFHYLWFQTQHKLWSAFTWLSLLFSLVKSQVILLISFLCLSRELSVYMCVSLDWLQYCSATPELIIYAANLSGFLSMQWFFQITALSCV